MRALNQTVSAYLRSYSMLYRRSTTLIRTNITQKKVSFRKISKILFSPSNSFDWLFFWESGDYFSSCVDDLSTRSRRRSMVTTKIVSKKNMLPVFVKILLASLLIVAPTSVSIEFDPDDPPTSTQLAETAKALRGRLLVAQPPPKSPDSNNDDTMYLEYEDARRSLLWNPDPTLQNKPAIIVQCEGAHDVQLGLELAKTLGMQLSVRSGGHNVRGLASNTGGVVLDLRRMRSVRVVNDEESIPFAWAEPGCKLADLHKETIPRGLVPATGTVGCTGLAGLTTGGGFNFFSRSIGYAVDNVLEVELVTANGDLIIANSKRNADLFWAIRGGGGSFGVVTAFKLQLHPIPSPMIYGGMYFVPPGEPCMDMIGAMDTFYDSSSNLDMSFGLLFHPDGVHSMCGNVVAHLGDPADAMENKPNAPVQKLRAAAPIISDMDMVNTMSLMDFMHSQDLGMCNAPGNYWTSIPFTKNVIFGKQGLAWIQAINATRPVGGIIVIEPWYGGDQAGRTVTKKGGREAATAFAAREADFTVMLIGMFDPDNPQEREEVVNWVRSGKQSAAKLAMKVTEYGGYSSDDGGIETSSSIRLRKIKSKWDPHNIFNRTQLNILPMGMSSEAEL